MKKIAIIGAFDRFNYGDLLFPLLLEKGIRSKGSDAELAYYATTSSDLSQWGGKPTRPIRELFNTSGKNTPDVVIVSGGDVLGSTWTEMRLNLETRRLMQKAIKIDRKLRGVERRDSTDRDYYGVSHLLLPWVLAPSDFRHPVQVVYNSVGGASISNLPIRYIEDIVSKLQQATYASFRDSRSLDYLSQFGSLKNIRVTPDSAVCLEAYYPKDSLYQLAGKNLALATYRFKSGYICFQINRHYGEANRREIITQLHRIIRDTGLPIILLPIGTAPGHEDDVILQSIASEMREDVFVPLDNTVFDIMAMIANAHLFIGTSLHGCITSLSYGVPAIGLDRKVRKLDAFLEQWGVDGLDRCFDYPEIFKTAKYALSLPQNILTEKSDTLSNIYRQSQFEMLSEIT